MVKIDSIISYFEQVKDSYLNYNLIMTSDIGEAFLLLKEIFWLLAEQICLLLASFNQLFHWTKID